MGSGEDKISHLPNEILEYILCLMPLKYAIKTSTLSKRWRHLWQTNLISSTSLQFGKDFSCNQSLDQFSETLDRYIQLHGSRNLDKFGILFSPLYDFYANFIRRQSLSTKRDYFSNLENWIRTVIAKRVKELDVDFSYVEKLYYFPNESMPFSIPDSLFDCNTLTHLSLSRCLFSTTFNLTNFARLNSLSLDSINITDDMLPNILQACISLENISLIRCGLLKMVKIIGDKLELRKLVMVDCLCMSDIEILAPKLESFVIHGSIWLTHYFGNVSNVTDAYLCFDETETYEEGVSEVLSEFSHVKILTMSSFSLTHVVDEEEQNEDYFSLELRNLQELQLILDSISEEHLHGVFSFFRLCSSPFLEKLFIQCPSNLNQRHDLRELVTAKRDTPAVIFLNLKWIKLTNFGGSPLELELVKFLFEKAVVLETIFLVTNQSAKSNNSFFQIIVRGLLSLLPKTSIDARIVICGPSDQNCTMNPTHRTYYHEYQN